MNTKILIASTALASVLMTAPASAQLIGGAGGLGGNVGGAIGNSTGSITGSAMGSGALNTDTGVVDRATQRAEREARQATREARRAAREAEDQATQARNVDLAGSGAATGALDAGPLSAQGDGAVDASANIGVDPGPTAERVTTTARNTTSRARGAARSTVERVRNSAPNASVDGAASGAASANSDGVSADGEGSGRVAANRNPD
jgi:hypothetical protein